MIKQFRETVARSHATLIQDMIGVAALGVMLFVGLTLPGLI